MTLGPVLVGIEGTALTAQTVEQLGHPLVGGVVLFTRNFENRDQVAALAESIRVLREPRLLVAVDQEGGRVQRFREGFTRLPPLGRIGALYASDPEQANELAYWHARVMSAEMLELGVDLSFAPVLDLDRGSEVIGDRAFSGSVEAVVELGRAYLSGMHDAGMKTTAKHFPGHGSIQADSHIADVCDSRDFEEIDSSDLVPFRELAGACDAMMIAHVVYPCLDDRPAGYSRRWLRDCLRKGIGFRGVIFSDDLGMHAAKSLGNLVERTKGSLEAGCDAALVCRPGDVAELLRQWRGDVPDAAAALVKLYGKLAAQTGKPSTVAGDELAAWKDRLEALQHKDKKRNKA